jgi:hypothetical protein
MSDKIAKALREEAERLRHSVYFRVDKDLIDGNIAGLEYAADIVEQMRKEELDEVEVEYGVRVADGYIHHPYDPRHFRDLTAPAQAVARTVTYGKWEDFA